MEYKHLKEWRKRTKERLLKAMGGKCQICGYDKCNSALEFHHLNPEEKEINIGSSKMNNWGKLVLEVKKCVLLCSRCHKEVHCGITEIPQSYETFNPLYEEYKDALEGKDKCPVCGKLKPKRQTTCSRSCSNKYSNKNKVDWENTDLLKMLNENEWNFSKTGRDLGITGNAVKKRYNKITKQSYEHKRIRRSKRYFSISRNDVDQQKEWKY